jgi:hypothetical protein
MVLVGLRYNIFITSKAEGSDAGGDERVRKCRELQGSRCSSAEHGRCRRCRLGLRTGKWPLKRSRRQHGWKMAACKDCEMARGICRRGC